MKIRFAFAVNHANIFEMKHFREADKYLIYEWVNEEFILKQEIKNPYSDVFEEPQHGATFKKMEIINLLKEHQVNVLVSKQFGKNIQLINGEFIPVLIAADSPKNLFPTLKRQVKWIAEELAENFGNYKLFNLNKGALKTSIKA